MPLNPTRHQCPIPIKLQQKNTQRRVLRKVLSQVRKEGLVRDLRAWPNHEASLVQRRNPDCKTPTIKLIAFPTASLSPNIRDNIDVVTHFWLTPPPQTGTTEPSTMGASRRPSAVSLPYQLTNLGQKPIKAPLMLA